MRDTVYSNWSVTVKLKNAQDHKPSQLAASQANRRMLSMEKNPTEHDATGPRIEPSSADRVIESRTLFGQRKEVAIEHDGALYRLKITKQGKLILNK